ncbi:MAG: hypothetical protein ACJ789_05185 [Thermomicrobiales bacterium]
MQRPPFLALPGLSRRAALGRVAAVGAALGLGGFRHATAQDATPTAMASHPIVGVWNVITANGPAPGVFLADGTNIIAVPATQAGPQGVAFVSTQVGRWEPVSERGIHFTSIQLLSDANGVYTGSVTVDGYPVVSEDGQTILDDLSQTIATIRDATGAIVQQAPAAGSPPVTGNRMEVGAPNFPAGTPVAGTPTP